MVNAVERDILIGIAASAFESREVHDQLTLSLIAGEAEQHGLLPLAQTLLSRRNRKTNQESESQISGERLILAARYMHFMHQLRRILEAFQAARVDVIVLKGPALAETIYPDPLLRPFRDFDLLCREEDWESAHKTLVALGFTPLVDSSSPPPKAWHRKAYYHNQYYNPTTRLMVEIHFDLWQIGFRPRSGDLVWKRARQIKIADVDAKILSGEDQIFHLCVHLQHHSYKKLIWFVDLALLLRAYEQEIDWQYISDTARRDELTLPVFYSLFYLERFFGIPAPSGFMTSIRPKAMRAWLHNRMWPPDQVLGLSIDKEIQLNCREVPIANELVYALLLLGHARETLIYLSRILVPSGTWLARYYGTSDPNILRRRRIVHAPKMLLAGIIGLASMVRLGMPFPFREEHETA